MIEYNSMAKYYDLFYSNKSYERETDFLKELIGNRKTVLDVGCGTGVHMHLLEDSGYIVDGLDLNSGMLDIAKTRVKGNLIEANLLDFNIKKKYDSIISMFAVFNHLNDYNEFEEGIMHCYKYLNENGILIIDLHNGRKSGEKVSEYKDYKRIMSWKFDEKKFKEYSNIQYIVGDSTYEDKNEFIIYEVEKIKKILDKNKLNYKLYENYSLNKADDFSKNIEIVIWKI